MVQQQETHRARRLTLGTLAVLVIGLVAFRIYLPTLISNKLNAILENLPSYTGHVRGVDIHLWRGAYSIFDLTLKKRDGHVPVPFLKIDDIDFSIAWKPLFQGNLSGKIELVHPVVNFVSGKAESSRQMKVDSNWQDSVKQMFPLRIARLGIKEGEVHFQNFEATPPVDVYIDSITLVATNLTNSKRVSRSLKATLDATAVAMHSGHMQTHVDLDPLSAKPNFSMALKIEKLDLADLNSFFKYYLAVEAKTGTLNFYVEGAAVDGEFKGYVKPLFENLDVLKVKEDAGIGEFFKALAVKLVSYTFKNHRQDQLGTKVIIEGPVTNPTPDTWSAIVNFFHNWFVKALFKGFDQRHSTTP